MVNRRISILLMAAGLLAATVADSRATGICTVPHWTAMRDGAPHRFPPEIEKGGLTFAGSTVPIQRRDVSERILNEINYLLLDRRSRVLQWLTAADHLRPVIAPVLEQYKLPGEFIYLAAIESNYSGRAMSSAGAYGYWQFIKPTAKCGPSGCPELDWTMQVTPGLDERGDLVKSTHSAARYLAWMNRVKRVSIAGNSERDGFSDWLLAAAAYNAGPAGVTRRLTAYGASSYWDVRLPIETEKYVPRWIALGLISKYRDFYGIQVPPRAGLSFETLTDVKLEKDLSLAAMARLLDVSPREAWQLNTQIPSDRAVFQARVGRKAVKHTIRVPGGKGKKFLTQLAAQGYTKKK